ncbi:hypothetical protein Z043_109256 [Scleropages formosus]|uniref:Myelin basic protein n=1 Tax=Scleropages formosus TaxID=113540 RepID=A0A0P7UQD0_SCLFO|nr:hypothetical protein Z043_109256 [Scleropages formosus]
MPCCAFYRELLVWCERRRLSHRGSHCALARSIDGPCCVCFFPADAFANNGSSCKGTAATDSSRAGDTRHGASAADPGGPRPHLVRLFSRDAPGRQDNTFKDRPSESDELHTIQEQGGAEHAEQDAD